MLVSKWMGRLPHLINFLPSQMVLGLEIWGERQRASLHAFLLELSLSIQETCIPLEDRDERLTKILSREKIKYFRNAVRSVKETRG